MQGLHFTADLYDCNVSLRTLSCEVSLSRICRFSVKSVGLTLVADKWYTFPDYNGHKGGVTGAVLLAESHLAIHTWPEKNCVTLDVYVCNFESDNSKKAEQLMDMLIKEFNPIRVITNRLDRGEIVKD